jgi:hypothetical protein
MVRWPDDAAGARAAPAPAPSKRLVLGVAPSSAYTSREEVLPHETSTERWLEVVTIQSC